MLRLLDAPAAIAGRGFPAGAQRRTSRSAVTDAQLPANSGDWRLEVSGGRGRPDQGRHRAGPRAGSAPALRLGARGLAALYAGTPLAALRRAGLAAGGDSGRRRRPGRRVRAPALHDRSTSRRHLLNIWFLNTPGRVGHSRRAGREPVMSQPNTCSLATGRRGCMRVLGVDPGLTRCGLGVVDGVAGRPLSHGQHRRRADAARRRDRRPAAGHRAGDRGVAGRLPARRGRGGARVQPAQRADRDGHGAGRARSPSSARPGTASRSRCTRRARSRRR